GMSRGRDCVRRPERCEEPGQTAEEFTAELRLARRLEHRAANDLFGGAAESEPRAGIEVTTEAPQQTTGRPDHLPSDDPSYLAPGHSFRTVTDKISSIVLVRPTPAVWLLAFAINLGLLMLLAYAIIYLLVR